jgi:sugar phosphate isomerase/epimerase
MKITVSNIAWEDSEQDEVLFILKSQAIEVLEIAPTRLWPNWEITDCKPPLPVVAFQSIMFRLPLELFGESKSKMLSHCKKVVDMASQIGVKIIVFGSPKNRRRNTEVKLATALAIEFLKELGDYAAHSKKIVCIEANPEAYGCNFITTAQESATLVRQINSLGIKLHLDTACMYLSNDSVEKVIEENADILNHVHVSEPYLAGFENPVINHKLIAKSLRLIDYQEYVSIEMKPGIRNVERVSKALDYVIGTYS